ncbi:coproporphyrinogen-III oxidase family protein [Paraburkholderia lycopersici]|uniref:Oxygen-independent coproporphyrinogen-3 oxidase n=1 Tax=Paraburkholderia lycopersici TaxID=416944 RepID=A0A1G6GV94_9BURK|nr:radical SAM protein [Paraburkholderia lycopersici]SDB85864.1 oxygen-independent coproporphyrinogen-3 oxidase [Paraburkholderia lycopersici]
MRLTGHSVIKFDSFLPLYNWIYPIGGSASKRFIGKDAADVFHHIQPSLSRALYIHIPFCDTICSFCPFVRTAGYDSQEIGKYVQTLVREIELKARIPTLTSTPIGAVFFGGGTPSVLSPHQIRTIGNALRENFDLGKCREFSFEFEVKSATEARVAAALDIGVTHARFGAQTFVPSFRKHFRLSASVEVLNRAAQLLQNAFPHSSCDILYGMHGQTEEDLEFDIEQASNLGLANLDFYPLNNLVTQPVLSTSFANSNSKPTSGLTKHYMSLYVREALRTRGYLPHNGHGFVRTQLAKSHDRPLITPEYSFVYHEHTLGYPSHDVLGFGVNAISSFSGFVVSNTESRKIYDEAISDGQLPIVVREHSRETDACRPLALALPYHGEIPRSWIDTNFVPHEIMERLVQLRDHGLVRETSDAYALTEDGLAWYVNMMFYLSPEMERFALAKIIQQALGDKRRRIEESGLSGFNFGKQIPIHPQ